MGDCVTRRTLLKRGVAVGAGVGAVWPSVLAKEEAPPSKTRMRKAVIVGKAPDEETLAEIKAAGFDGVECRAWNATAEEAETARKAADAVGLQIHSIMGGGGAFGDLERVDAAVESVEGALRTARAFGADAILLVPGRVRGVAMPEPWEFDVAFDEETTHLSRVVAGDNGKYQDYIEAHNHSTDVARQAITRLIPAAEKSGVVMAVENVWNNLWVTPGLMKSLVASFHSPWVRAYYDIGNHVKYGVTSEQWIGALGALIAKCHVKDFLLNPDGHGGKFVDIRDGSVDWPSVRKALDRIGYNGWMTIEGSGGLSLTEKSQRLDLILAGK